MSEFRPAVETTARWRVRQSTVLLWVFFGLALLIAATAVNRDWSAIDALLAGLVVVVGLRLYVAVSGRHATRSGTGVLWSGPASLRIKELRSAGVADDIRLRKERRLRRWTRGLNVANARMEVRPDEIRWTLGRVARILGATGTVRVACSDIARIEVGRIPGTLPGFGGGIAINLANGHHFDVQFLGSRADIEAALAAASSRNR